MSTNMVSISVFGSFRDASPRVTRQRDHRLVAGVLKWHFRFLVPAGFVRPSVDRHQFDPDPGREL